MDAFTQGYDDRMAYEENRDEGDQPECPFEDDEQAIEWARGYTAADDDLADARVEYQIQNRLANQGR